LNVHLLHSDSLAAGHLGVSDGQSESESESDLYALCGHCLKRQCSAIVYQVTVLDRIKWEDRL